MEEKGFIHNLLNRFATADGQLVAFSIYDGNQLTDITYHQFLRDILKTAGFFAENQIHNQHIALAAPNSYHWIVAFYGILASGNIAVLINPALPADIIAEQCRQADVTVFCCETKATDELKSVSNGMQLLYIDDILNANPIRFEDIYNTADDETIILLGTSGTTGKSKIVEVSSKNMWGSLLNSDQASHVKGLERCILVLPLYHIGGVMSATSSFYRSKTLCIGRGASYIFPDMAILNPTQVPFVPSMMESVEKLFRRNMDPVGRAKYVGSNLQRIMVAGAAPKQSTCQYFIDQGIAVETAYAMTETTGAGTWAELNESNVGTIGKMYGNLQICFQAGELLMKGDAVMKGYYKDPEETAKVIEDGWLHTGDMGYCDENGYYYITGRKKNVIILSNGENVNPEEIEAKWGSCTHILECMVYSDGKGICADVYTENQEAAAAYIKEYNYGMPMYRQVYKVNYSATPLEKTSTGKIKRKENK